MDETRELIIEGLKRRLHNISHAGVIDNKLLKEDYIDTLKLLIDYLSTLDIETPEIETRSWEI